MQNSTLWYFSSSVASTTARGVDDSKIHDLQRGRGQGRAALEDVLAVFHLTSPKVPANIIEDIERAYPCPARRQIAPIFCVANTEDEEISVLVSRQAVLSAVP